MPKIEDLERLGSIAFLLGNKALPKEISQSDYDRFKSVFTDEHMASSMPAEDNGLPSIDDLDLDDEDSSSQSDDLPKESEEKNTEDLDDLGLPEDLGLDEDLNLHKTQEASNVSDDTDDLGLPEDLGLDENLNLHQIPEDEKVSADIDDLDLPKDLEDEKVSADIDDLDLPKDLEDEYR